MCVSSCFGLSAWKSTNGVLALIRGFVRVFSCVQVSQRYDQLLGTLLPICSAPAAPASAAAAGAGLLVLACDPVVSRWDCAARVSLQQLCASYTSASSDWHYSSWFSLAGESKRPSVAAADADAVAVAKPHSAASSSSTTFLRNLYPQAVRRRFLLAVFCLSLITA